MKSERQLAQELKVNRGTLRKVKKMDGSLEIGTLKNVNNKMNKSTHILSLNQDDNLLSEYSIPVITMLVAQGGDWRIHYFNFVDYFKKTKDERLIILPPSNKLEKKYYALIASIVSQMCFEMKLEIPAWAQKTYWLSKEPWFVAGIENLKSSAIVESPIFFRKNNIWVLENFLSRA